MKRFQAIIGSTTIQSPRVLACFCTVVAALALSPALARATVPQYDVVAIGPRGIDSFSYSIGINSRGDVVGQVGTTNQVPFLYRRGRFARMRPPAGVSDAQSTGINNADVVPVQATGPDGSSLAFAVRPKGDGFSWIRLPTGSLHCDNVSVANVASNGDIDGGLTVILPGGAQQQRAVLWRVKADGRYQAARLLPMSRGFVATVAGGIWNRNGRSYVAGAQGNGGAFQEVSLWSPRPTLTSVPNQMPFASTIGGAASRVYAAGTSWSMSATTYYAWVSKVTFDQTGAASLQSVDFLPMYPGYDQAAVEGVAVDSHDRPVIVGDVVSTNGGGSRGALWRKAGPATLLQSLIGSSPWTVTGAGGINVQGEIAAVGTRDRTDHAILLRPRR